MTEHFVHVQMRILTESAEHCSEKCPHYICGEYECRLFKPGELLSVSGHGDSFRYHRHAECVAATEGE